MRQRLSGNAPRPNFRDRVPESVDIDLAESVARGDTASADLPLHQARAPAGFGQQQPRSKNELSLYGTDRRAMHSQTMTAPLANYDLEREIALRWALRDILGDRLKLSPLKEDDLRSLLELGFVEIRDDALVVTQAGLAALN
jgi:hypothetical protein